MEAARFERTVRTDSSEIFGIYGGARRMGRIDLHYGRFEVHGTLLLEVDLSDDELQQVIDQIDPSKLASEQRQTLSSVQDFVTKATEALRAKDTARAKILADKASHLADDLALALKGAK